MNIINRGVDLLTNIGGFRHIMEKALILSGRAHAGKDE